MGHLFEQEIYLFGEGEFFKRGLAPPLAGFLPDHVNNADEPLNLASWR